jgi:hypothetical protein
MFDACAHPLAGQGARHMHPQDSPPTWDLRQRRAKIVQVSAQGLDFVALPKILGCHVKLTPA